MSSAFCHRILEGLWAAGVRDMVVTPGSRSTPLLLAALRSKLRLHSVIDERSAAFFALGRARAQGRSVALLCTSGSAGAHYLPALLEARYAQHGLIALTADRPPELHGTGSNQTIDQRMLFAAACACVEIPVPEASDAAARDAAMRVHRAVALADGPVHINLAFRKPLEPSPDEVAPSPFELPPVRRPDLKIDARVTDKLLERFQATTKGVIICGPLADAKLASSVQMLARKLAFPLLAESTSGARFVGEKTLERVDGFTHILGIPSLASALQPEIILHFGAAPASGPLLRWLDASDAKCVHFTGSQPWRARQETVEIVRGDAAGACQTLAAQATQQPGSDYLSAWRGAEERCWKAAELEVARERDGLSEAKAISAVLRGLAADTQLTIGNSLPIRSTDSVTTGDALQLRVLHQRGTSGIEGLIAGALGSAHAGRSALLIGDVSCAHDLSSLALHDLAEGPLLIIVIDNGGGKIFSHLPVAGLALPNEDWTFWETPPQVDFALACAAYGVVHRLCENEDELAGALLWAQSTKGVSMVQIKVQPDSMRTFLSNVQGALA